MSRRVVDNLNLDNSMLVAGIDLFNQFVAQRYSLHGNVRERRLLFQFRDERKMNLFPNGDVTGGLAQLINTAAFDKAKMTKIVCRVIAPRTA